MTSWRAARAAHRGQRAAHRDRACDLPASTFGTRGHARRTSTLTRASVQGDGVQLPPSITFTAPPPPSTATHPNNLGFHLNCAARDRAHRQDPAT